MKTHTCPACHGRQVQMILRSWWMAVRCSVCGGKGKVPAPDTVPAPVATPKHLRVRGATNDQTARLQSALV